ncbi:twitching motility protein [Thermocrinis sp.]
MNYAPQVLNYLSDSKDASEVFLAPNAFPVERKNGKLVKFIDTVLTSEDTRDTLVALRSHVPALLGPLGREGSFSFSLHRIGRFRVIYMTQRGSYVISIVKTPFNIPEIEDICEDPSNLIKEVNRFFWDLTPGLVIITGKSSIKVSIFSYSLLKYISSNFAKVIFVLEKPLNYLLKHGSSLVIQREIGVDVESWEEALRDATLINPDVLYLGFKELFDREETNNIVRIMGMGALVILNLPYFSKEKILTDLEELKAFLKKMILVESSEDRDILRITFKEIPTRE